MKKIALAVTATILCFTATAQIDSSKKSEFGLQFTSTSSFGICYKFGSSNMLFRISAASLNGASNSTDYNSYSYNNNTSTITPNGSTSSFGIGLNIALEFRKPIGNRFYFYCGPALINSFSQSNTNTVTPQAYTNGYYNSSNVYTIQSVEVNNITDTKITTINSGLGCIIGGAYNLGKSFSFGVEIVPSVTYTSTETNTTAQSYGVIWTSKGVNGYSTNEYLTPSSSDKVTSGFSLSAITSGANITIAYKIK